MQFFSLLGLSLIASVVALMGGVLFLYNAKASKALEKHAIPFAAGTMITIALLGLIPESIEMVGLQSLWIVLISFIVAYIFENVVVPTHHHNLDDHHHGHKHEHAIKSGTAGLVIIGDTIHNFIDGLAIGATYLANPGLGLITTISTFLHEVPHEIGDFGILLKAGWEKKNILLVNIASALFTVPGAFAVYFFSDDGQITGSLLAVAAGVFLYLGTIDFIPHAFQENKNKVTPLLSMLTGVLVMIAVVMLVPHTHPENEAHDHNHDRNQDAVIKTLNTVSEADEHDEHDNEHDHDDNHGLGEDEHNHEH